MTHLDDEFLSLPHEFVLDLNQVVTVNLKLTLDAIERMEDEEIAKVADQTDDETYRSIQNSIGNFADDLRTAANNLAMVTIAIRLDHWVRRFVEKNADKLKPPTTKRDSQLIVNLDSLKETFGEGPVPIDFFKDLVNVRDAVVHADSQPKWTDHRGQKRSVADRYVKYGYDVRVENEQVSEAIANAIEQVEWYDEQV